MHKYMIPIPAYFNQRIFILSTLLLVCHHFSCVSSQTDGRDDFKHPCIRPCVENSTPMKCHYEFQVEVYYVLSLACFNCPVNVDDCYRPDCIAADATNKSVLVVNRKLPGPSIQVCKDDVIVVDVENDANPQTTSIHWHGLSQHNYQFMDGLPMVTQCPIDPETTFRYKYPVPEAGTYWWHSHSGHQKDDGVFGALIVRQEADQKTYKDLYDLDLPEHVVVVNDWYNMSTTEDLSKDNFYRMVPVVQSILVNGRGRYGTIYLPDGRKFQTPLSVFNVTKGKRYRFRLIGSGAECGLQVSIEGHRLQIIEVDGRPIVPFTVDAVNIYSGERYDFVLTANNSVANYWIKINGLETCKQVETYQVAILRYDGAPVQDPPGTPSYNMTKATGFILNPATADNRTMVGAVVMLNTTSTNTNEPTLKAKADVKVTLRYDYRILNDTIYNRPIYTHDMTKDLFHNRHGMPLINYIFQQMPSSPLLSQYDQVDQSALCDQDSLRKQGRDCTVDFCACTHVIKLPLNSVVQLLLIDDGVYPSGNGNHPIHLHGFHFRVVAMGRFPPLTTATLLQVNNEVARLQQLVKDDKLPLKLDTPIYKDTINVPNGGYAIVRVYTDNPGFWFLHCHIDAHMELGMGLIFQVGDQKKFPKPPKNFPKCGDFVPKR